MPGAPGGVEEPADSIVSVSLTPYMRGPHSDRATAPSHAASMPDPSGAVRRHRGVYHAAAEEARDPAAVPCRAAPG